MLESLYWLLKAFLWFDVSILVVTGVLLLVTFPKRICHAIRKNCQRLNGSISKRRKTLEQVHFMDFMAGVLVVVLLLLLAFNAIVYIVHTRVVPLPLAADAFQQFDWDKHTWRANLVDPAAGDIAGQFADWQESGSVRARFNLFGLVTTWPVLVLFGILVGSGMLISLGRVYISCLTNYERAVHRRYQEYFAHDMKRRHGMVERQSRA